MADISTLNLVMNAGSRPVALRSRPDWQNAVYTFCIFCNLMTRKGQNQFLVNGQPMCLRIGCQQARSAGSAAREACVYKELAAASMVG